MFISCHVRVLCPYFLDLNQRKNDPGVVKLDMLHGSRQVILDESGLVEPDYYIHEDSFLIWSIVYV